MIRKGRRAKWKPKLKRGRKKGKVKSNNDATTSLDPEHHDDTIVPFGSCSPVLDVIISSRGQDDIFEVPGDPINEVMENENGESEKNEVEGGNINGNDVTEKYATPILKTLKMGVRLPSCWKVKG